MMVLELLKAFYLLVHDAKPFVKVVVARTGVLKVQNREFPFLRFRTG
jgi:hypothetical protein